VHFNLHTHVFLEIARRATNDPELHRILTQIKILISRYSETGQWEKKKMLFGISANDAEYVQQTKHFDVCVEPGGFWITEFVEKVTTPFSSQIQNELEAFSVKLLAMPTANDSERRIAISNMAKYARKHMGVKISFYQAEESAAAHIHQLLVGRR
jgi:hypothetical protein